MHKFLAVLVLVLAACTPVPKPVEQPAACSSCSSTEVESNLAVTLKTVEYLTSDPLQGRKVGSEGEKAAANYVVGQLRQMGLAAEVQPFSKGVNAYGIVPGKVEEAVVIGCHLDHLGADDKGIYRGADDNASGVAAVLSLAARFAEQPARRTIVVCFFGGEEGGILGSRHYAKNQVRPTVAMVNLDMVGRMKAKKLHVMGAGTSDVWEKYFTEANRHGLTLQLQTGGGVGNSDHTSFYQLDLPVVHLFTGLHGDYHKVTDTAEKINYVGMDLVIDLVEKVVRRVADADARPAFIKVKEEQPPDRPEGELVPTLGAMPDFEYSDKMVVGMVAPGSPAEKAGLKVGDAIMAMDGAEVKSLDDFSNKLNACKVGQQVTLKVKRGEQILEMKAVIGGKKPRKREE